eukprot:Gregarina_sp_Poly_1__3912@NODE_2170_length_2564_cov_79_219864_g1399_i0_p2_GENE_NODE_2170_length_2564_cov_79_219864_g1399_i0NODE_2170_length_2564_cov_79_219864_g1399_i0_p2_ORF_typecomplete_len218_score21_47_NODE_2170_length_2564_cov_79_219864_g1399_i0131784
MDTKTSITRYCVGGQSYANGRSKINYSILNYSPVVHIHMLPEIPHQNPPLGASHYLVPTRQALISNETGTGFMREQEEASSGFRSSDFYAKANSSDFYLHPMSFETPISGSSKSQWTQGQRRMSLRPVNCKTLTLPINSAKERFRSLPAGTRAVSRTPSTLMERGLCMSPSTQRLIAPSATSGRHDQYLWQQNETDSVIDWNDCVKLKYWRQVLCCE